jgi:hypothetical protein
LDEEIEEGDKEDDHEYIEEDVEVAELRYLHSPEQFKGEMAAAPP